MKCCISILEYALVEQTRKTQTLKVKVMCQ